jgi:DNA-binding response OmpR family regulator
MTTKALVVDDDPDILDVVSDILESLGHECDRADSVESARQCLDRDEYTYVLLDLEIPVRAGRSFARVQNGENLLEEMIQRRGSRKTPVIIIMTAHGTDGHELAVDVMKKGAVDYVAKPFKTVGRTLDKSIREALSRVGDSPVHQLATAVLPKIGKAEQTIQPKVFSGGEMVFYADHVELCGVIICGGPRCEPARKALALLRQKSTKGDFVALGSRKLAEMIGRDGGPNSVPGLIQGLRKRMIQELRAIGIQCGLRDVIVRTNHGYQLNDWITVQEGNEGTERAPKIRVMTRRTSSKMSLITLTPMSLMTPILMTPIPMTQMSPMATRRRGVIGLFKNWAKDENCERRILSGNSTVP